MKTNLLAYLLFVSTITTICQEPNHYGFGGIKTGIFSYKGVSNFNEQLLAAGQKELPEFGFSAGGYYYSQFGMFGMGAEGIAIFCNSKVNPPGLKVNLNTYQASWNLGINVFGKTIKTRLEPFIGIAFNLTQFIATSHDTLITFNQFLSGAQNMYFEQSNAGILFNSGIRFSKHFSNQKRYFGVMAQFDYFGMLNKMKWSIPDMPIQKLSGLNFSLGFLIGFKRIEIEK